MLLDLVYYPDPILTKQTKEIGEVDDEIRTLAENMIETMYENKGVGLAAPQIGLDKRICVIDVSEERDEPMVFINPHIDQRKGSQESEEGCLSFPKVYGKVERAETIRVKYLDLEGREQLMEEVDDFLAIVLQHEVDHLDGILFIDLMKPTEKMKIKKDLKQLKENYRNKIKA